ncbi:MAG: DUF4062 domain-containing protein [Phycisphaerales bacterium]|nr:DUF4062 domain-containing protein [Phycisphaerales bacterium]
MAYKAIVCNVMIASPSDVDEERKIAREVLWGWNYLHSERMHIILMPVGWDTRSFPAMDDRPQAIINKQVLEPCDLLIGIFWTRLGTPTGQETSGTVEEIGEFRKKGKPVMLYFSSVPVRPDSIDEIQYNKLKEFKEQCRTDGLIDEYAVIAEFKDKLTKHLTRTVDDNEYVKRIISTYDRESLATYSGPNSGPQLTEEARELLLEAVQDASGIVIRVMTSSGLTIQTNKKNMLPAPKEPRCQALWKAALNELSENNFLEDTNHLKLTDFMPPGAFPGGGVPDVHD